MANPSREEIGRDSKRQGNLFPSTQLIAMHRSNSIKLRIKTDLVCLIAGNLLMLQIRARNRLHGLAASSRRLQQSDPVVRPMAARIVNFFFSSIDFHMQNSKQH